MRQYLPTYQLKSGNLISSVFGASEALNIEFVDDVPLPSYADGHTGPDYDYTPDGKLNIQIQLNKDNLQSYSQEYIARVIMHEALHAYLISTRTDASMQHEEITKYVVNMAKSLQKMFPGLNDLNAKNLSLGGLQMTDAFRDTIKTDLGLEATFDATQLSYSVGIAGKHCK